MVSRDDEPPKAVRISALASRAGLALQDDDAEALAALVHHVASQVLVADAELRLDASSFPPAYLT